MTDAHGDAEHWKRESDLRSEIINHLQTELADARARLVSLRQQLQELLYRTLPPSPSDHP